jgi:hypothetical protein
MENSRWSSRNSSSVSACPFLRELRAVLGQNHELRTHLILKPADFTADRRVARPQQFGGLAQAAGFGDPQEGAQFPPIVAAQQIRVVEGPPRDRRCRRVERMRAGIVPFQIKAFCHAPSPERFQLVRRRGARKQDGNVRLLRSVEDRNAGIVNGK